MSTSTAVPNNLLEVSLDDIPSIIHNNLHSKLKNNKSQGILEYHTELINEARSQINNTLLKIELEGINTPDNIIPSLQNGKTYNYFVKNQNLVPNTPIYKNWY